MAARDPISAATRDETTPAAAMDQEPNQGNEEGTWFLIPRKRKKQVQATSSLPPNMEPTQQGQAHGRLRKKGSQLPALPIDDLKVLFRPRDGINLVVSTPDEELAARLQLIKAICLANKEYEVQAYVAAPDASCKGVISGIGKNTTPTTLMTNPRSPMAQVLHARMMGNSTTAIITFPPYRHRMDPSQWSLILKPRARLW
ncbi:hypothetical protein HPB49_007690 [Dermacentor silvarum]|uniref:Uncharacterized protein n=1 Tax=Dermacentor silvarum TaxID=543639 RepID=A0ACB8CDY5_DERSI|nr:hypothetical protein HPB49_007690 [Dermacentor silvarum]